jgi:DNA/RNA endonuclease YhcR with UshA esterase domain
MNRYDIINDLIIKYNYKTYLEIGVRNPYEIRIFEQNKKEHLNLVSIEEYREIFGL